VEVARARTYGGGVRRACGMTHQGGSRSLLEEGVCGTRLLTRKGCATVVVGEGHATVLAGEGRTSTWGHGQPWWPLPSTASVARPAPTHDKGTSSGEAHGGNHGQTSRGAWQQPQPHTDRARAWPCQGASLSDGTW